MAIQSAFWLPGQQGQWLQPLSIPSTASGLALRRAGPTPGTRRALLGTASHGDKRCLGSWQSRELRAGVRASAHHSSGPRPCSPASQGLPWQREGLLASILAAWTRPPSAGRCIRLGHEHGCEGGEPGMGGGSPAQGDTLYPCWSARWVCRPKISTSPSRRREMAWRAGLQSPAQSRTCVGFRPRPSWQLEASKPLVVGPSLG